MLHFYLLTGFIHEKFRNHISELHVWSREDHLSSPSWLSGAPDQEVRQGLTNKRKVGSTFIDQSEASTALIDKWEVINRIIVQSEASNYLA